MKQGLTTIDGKVYEKCKVVILPTDDFTSKISRGLAIDNLFYSSKGVGKMEKFISNIKEAEKPQHLYILSSEEIKKEDWIYHPIYKKVYQWIENSNIKFDFINAIKIIATTDSSLNLPRPSDAFIKKYCELGGIDEILVEYTDYYKEEQVPSQHIGSPMLETMRSKRPEAFSLDLKIAPDNTITIKEVKPKLFTLEEVERLCRDAYQSGYSYGLMDGPDSVVEFCPSLLTEDEWINKNLIK